MYQYTYENHFKFGYLQQNDQGQWVKNFYHDRQSPEDQWIVEYGKCTNGVKDFRSECIAAAEKIYNNRNGAKLDILFSGGSDSEIVLRSFLELGVDFNVHIMRYDDYLNAHDWSYAYVICQNLNIKPIFHDLNLLKFWQSDEFAKRAKLSKSVSPQLVPHMWLMDQVDGLPVMGSGECYTARHDILEMRKVDITEKNYNVHIPWVLYEREKIACWYRYPMSKGRDVVPAFFQYTPEIMVSFLADSTSVDLHNNRFIGKLSNKSSKFDIYKKYWPELIDRKKWSGFERVVEEDAVVRRKLRAAFGDYEYEYWSEVTSLLRYMMGEDDTFPINFSPPIKNPGMIGVTAKAIKRDLGNYLD